MKGEPNAFNAVVARYRTQAFTLILMMTRDKAVAEDLTQEAFLRAYRKLAMFDRDKPFYPWLAAISVRLTLNWISRVRPRQEQENDDMELASLEQNQHSLLENLEKDQRSQRLWVSVAKLPSREKLTVMMFYKQQLKVDEIAQILGVTAGTVKTFLHRGRSHLKAQLGSMEVAK